MCLGIDLNKAVIQALYLISHKHSLPMKPTLTPHRQTAKLTKKKKSRELLRN
jgi:hypothetical protein